MQILGKDCGCQERADKVAQAIGYPEAGPTIHIGVNILIAVLLVGWGFYAYKKGWLK